MSKKGFKRAAVLTLAAVMSLSAVSLLTACGKKEDPKKEEDINPGEVEDSIAQGADAAAYNAALSDFLTTYNDAKKATTLSERYAKMAIAEAKLLESAIMLPTKTRGGNYAISRVAPYTVDYSLWGNDYERFHQALIATEPLKSEDRTEMKAKWTELRGTGTYEAWAKKFLADKGYTLKDTYEMVYSSDPQTWDVLSTSQAADSEAIINTYDGLMEYDTEGTLKPALATGYTVSEDGLTWTFTLREGAKWVDSQGREVGNVTADDFVAGMQHMLDAQGGLEYLVQGIIVNADEYINGEVVDFAEVGVKAVDEHTVAYTLVNPTFYLDTMLGYGIFAPMNRAYYQSQGGKFGAEYDPAAPSYVYGTSPEHIAYCGPYTVTNATAESTIEFSLNESYWNKDNINLKKITWLYNDGKDVTKAYNDMKAGTIDGCGLNAQALELARQDGWFDKYSYISSTETTSFMMFLNMDRVAYANFNDDTKVVSPKTDAQKADAVKALNNINFRLAVCQALDRANYNKQSVGEDLKLNSLRNSYTPGNFVSMVNDVTVEINGKATTFKAGTFYGEIMQAQVTADGYSIKVWDPNGDDGVGSSDGFDGWYNPTAAKAALEKAATELGMEISAENPIYLDLPYYSASSTYVNQANAVKQSIEAALDNKVIVNLIPCATASEWYYSGYYPRTGDESNYDLCDLSGWGPDYGDPSTYLDTFLPNGAGYMTKSVGLY